MSDLEKLGLFSEPSYLAVGCPYEDPERRIPSNFKGLQLVTTPSKRGKGPDAIIGDFIKPLYVGEPYVEEEVHRRRQKMKDDKRNVVPDPFKPPSFSKKGRGNFGTLGDAMSYVSAPESKEPPKKKEDFAPRNMVTNPGRKGVGYGYPNILMGGGEYNYGSGGTAGADKKRKDEQKRAQRKILHGPFKVGRGTGYFDNNIYASSGADGEGSGRRKRGTGRPATAGSPGGAQGGKAQYAQHPGAFRPPSAPGASRFDTFNKYPEYASSEYAIQEEAWHKAFFGRTLVDDKAREKGAFKPSGGSKSLRTSTIMFHSRNVNRTNI